jgi:TRAP-type C4-dicarboxylate transport system permease small subunit
MGRLLGALSTFVTRLEEACLAGGIAGIAALTIANVLGRTLFGTSLAFAEEVSGFLIVFVTFLGIGYAAARRRHIRMTVLSELLPENASRRLDRVVAMTTAALLFVLTYLGLSYALGTMRTLGSVSPVLGVPLWIVFLSAPLGFFLGGVQYLLIALRGAPLTEAASGRGGDGP